MKLSFIAWMMKKRWLTSAQGRFLEALIVGTVGYALSVALDSLSAYTGNGSFSDAGRTALALGLAAGGQYLTKTLRDAAKERLAKQAEELKESLKQS